MAGRTLIARFAPRHYAEADRPERLAASFDAQGDVTQYQLSTEQDEIELYDGSGRLLSVTNRAGLTQTLTHDANGRISVVTNPTGDTEPASRSPFLLPLPSPTSFG